MFAFATVFAQTTTAPTVRFKTTLGDIDDLLLPGSAPKTVENFLKYMNKKAYDNSVFHRSVSGFIIQGGGFSAALPNLPAIAADPPVINEYRESNIRGTIAMAKLGDDPNSATNQWFFNLSNNNAAILNGQNGGFTVFGRIVDNASLAVMDRLAAVPVPSPSPLASPFNEIPLQNYNGTLQASNLLVVTSVTQIQTGPPPTLSDGGVQTAGAFGGFNIAAPGSYLELFGTNLADSTVDWSDSFTNSTAPTSLAGVSVTVGGQRAFISYVSPTQVNVQVPATVALNQNLSVVLTSKGQTTAAIPFAIRRVYGGMLAPAAFKVNGKQFVYASKGNTGTIVSNGTIPGIAAAPARPGETLVLFGSGFGDMSPFSIAIAGAIPSALGRLQFPVTVKIGGIDAEVLFGGVVPPFVGLYQFNIVVPPDAPSGDLLMEITQNNQPIAQTLYLPVQR
ncbi:MAG: peptidylprolyl isomerase [Acidobacteria bacterium]|nr:peptidylprolyl isomerase [Acidobacteriota bacterium]